MQYSVELRFSADAESRVRNIWQAASEFYGTTTVLDNGVIPHVALFVGDDGLRAVFDDLSPPGGQISLTGIQFFANGRIVYLAVQVSNELLAFHREVYRLALQHQCEIDPLYTPDRWIPHCTIAQECTRNVASALPVDKFDADIRSAILVRYPPTEMIGEKVTGSHSNKVLLRVASATKG